MKESLQEKLFELEQKLEYELDDDDSNIKSLMKDFLDLYKLSLEVEDHKSTWINNRLYQIKKRKNPRENNALVVVHIIPHNSFQEKPMSLNLQEFTQKHLPLLDGENVRSRVNYHGILYNDVDSSSYTQLYRNGMVELVSTSFCDNNQLYPLPLENGIIKTIKNYLKVMNTVLDSPVDLHISLLNIEGFYLSLPRTVRQKHMIDQQEIQLPIVTIDKSTEGIIKDLMEPTIDVLWNAGGYAKSLPLDAFY